MPVKERDGLLVAAGAAVMLVILFVVQSFVGGGLFGTETVTSSATTTVSTIPQGYQQLANVSANHLLTIESRNVSALLSGYESNATLELIGNAPPFAGTYHGTSEIAVLLNASFPGRLDSLTLANVTQTIAGPRGRYWTVNSTFDWDGFGPDGHVSGTIAARDAYVRQADGSWVIAQEIWNSIRFNCLYPACHF